jgi:hypothetical protein
MAHETLLKMIVNGLQNLAMDQQTLFEHLNLRALAHQFDETFEGAPYDPPVPSYPDVATSQTEAASLVATIAGNSALFVRYLGGEPASPITIDDQTADADLLRLTIDWGTIQSGVQKAIIQLYGPQPGPPPGLPHPGAASEQRLWAEIVAWLQKIAADSSQLTEVQHFETGSAPEEDSTSPLARIEQGAQRTTLNLMLIAGLLPYHLFRAARSAPQEAPPASLQASLARPQSARGRGVKRKKRPEPVQAPLAWSQKDRRRVKRKKRPRVRR